MNFAVWMLMLSSFLSGLLLGPFIFRLIFRETPWQEAERVARNFALSVQGQASWAERVIQADRIDAAARFGGDLTGSLAGGERVDVLLLLAAGRAIDEGSQS